MAEVPKAILWIRGGPRDGETVPLADGDIVLGREPTNDLMVDEMCVSRRHARIRGLSGGYWIEDLGSLNSTYVNGNKVESEGTKLLDNDRIELGGVDTQIHLVFRELEATLDGGSPPPG